ncbi:hypothetical protein HOLleu_14384 [Holothuria leucospilota]|uniref:Uncharacterized protein n=1 Tax=Holothuria leucospilota TaxID=206669 RepID=A0A9Q1C8N4_HOLLE|nr:hypothetical protein HOLleu_14384 [Holothuria leucospilota]
MGRRKKRGRKVHPKGDSKKKQKDKSHRGWFSRLCSGLSCLACCKQKKKTTEFSDDDFYRPRVITEPCQEHKAEKLPKISEEAQRRVSFKHDAVGPAVSSSPTVKEGHNISNIITTSHLPLSKISYKQRSVGGLPKVCQGLISKEVSCSLPTIKDLRETVTDVSFDKKGFKKTYSETKARVHIDTIVEEAEGKAEENVEVQEDIEDAVLTASQVETKPQEAATTRIQTKRKVDKLEEALTDEAQAHASNQAQAALVSDDDEEHEESTDRESLDEHDYFPLIPTSKTGLRGWLLDRRIHQFNIAPIDQKQRLPRGGNGIMSCAINHILLASDYYRRNMQDGSIFDSYDEIVYIRKRIFSTIAKGNQIHINHFAKGDFLEATEALSILRDKGYCPELRWNEMSVMDIAIAESMGVENDNVSLPASLDLEITAPSSDESSLAKYVGELDVDKKEALIYVFNSSFMLFVPTEDGRVLLFDVHPHMTLNGGAIILVSPMNREDIQAMLTKYHTEHFQGSEYTLGQGTIFCIDI